MFSRLALLNIVINFNIYPEVNFEHLFYFVTIFTQILLFVYIRHVEIINRSERC